MSFALTVLLIAIAMRLPLASEDESPRTTTWLLGYLFVVLVAGTWLSARAARRAWSNYRLELSPDSLRRVQHRLADLTIDRAEVTTIEEMPGRGLTVRTADSDKFIYIPVGLDHYDEVCADLAAWAPLTKLSLARTWTRQWAGVTAALLIVGWMVATIFSSSVSFVVPSAFAISVFLLWTFIAAQQSRHLDRRTKIAMWLVVFPILALTLKSLRLLAEMR